MNKEKEKFILKMVYDPQDYDKVEDSEVPDFRIKNKGDFPYFGVEITEFYVSESNARLLEIPNYAEDIIKRDKFRHKVDKTSLSAEPVEVFSSEGKSKGTTRAIIRQAPNGDDCCRIIAGIIQKKSLRVESYKTELSHVNLIIFDEENVFSLTSVERFNKYFYTENMKATLLSTDFREVFFVTLIEPRRKVYFPLKAILLLRSFFLFCEMMAKYPFEKQEPEGADANQRSDRTPLMVFAHYLCTKTREVYIRDNLHALEVTWGNTGIRLGQEGGTDILDYNDLPLPQDNRKPSDEELIDFFKSQGFTNNEKDILNEILCSVEITFDVKQVVG